MDNLRHWNAYADIDPAFTKPITGKPYKGTSPNPQYVIRCLTDLFGPVGEGFGWDVVAEAFEPMGEEVLHWCRIKFWHTSRANTYDSYGQTKALAKTKNGLVLDEDAPKKSLTDAIIKASSHLGIAANIFLGRWDDQKYVAQVDAEYRQEERDAAAPPFDAAGCEARLIAGIDKRKTKQDLAEYWRGEGDALSALKAASNDAYQRVRTAFADAASKATDDPARQAPPQDQKDAA